MEINAVPCVRLNVSGEVAGGDFRKTLRDRAWNRRDRRITSGKTVPSAIGKITAFIRISALGLKESRDGGKPTSGQDHHWSGKVVHHGQASKCEEFPRCDRLLGSFTHFQDALVEIWWQEE